MIKNAFKNTLAMASRHSPKKMALLVTFILITGVLEGVSFVLFLPLIQVMTRGQAASAIPFLNIQPTLPMLLLGILAIFAVKDFFLFYQRWYAAKLTLDFERTLKEDLFASVFESDWQFVTHEKTGTLTNAMSQYARIAADTLKVMTLMAAEVVYVLVYCVVGVTMSLNAFCLSAAIGAIVFVWLKKNIIRSRAIAAKAVEIKNSTMSRVIEDFEGIKSIKGNRLEEFRKKSVFELLTSVMHTELKGEWYAAFMEALPDFIMVSVACFVLFISHGFFHVPGERLMVLVMVLYRLNRRLMLLQGFWQRLSLYLPYYDQCRDLIDRARLRKEKTGTARFDALQNGVELSGVSFSYEDHAVLKDLSLKIKKNALTAIVGRSGSGKTTVVDLVTGLLRSSSGTVAIDGMDLNAYDVFSWRKKIAYVPQDCLLVNGSIEENIRMDNLSASLDEVKKAALQAHADGFIQKQPSGYQTLVGDRGLRLSGGQKQRIALARALLRKPELLILDEATSALDNESEKMVQEAIEALRGKLTILVIAHRFSTIERADTVYVLHDGRADESGAAEELKKRSGVFQQLYELR